MASVNGDPDLDVRLNDSGSGGVFRVKDPSVSVFSVGDTGNITVSGQVTRGDPHYLLRTGVTTGTMLELGIGTAGAGYKKRLRFDYATGRAEVEAQQSGEDLRLIGDRVEFQRASSSGAIAAFLDNGGADRLFVEYDGGASQAKIKADDNLGIHFGGTSASSHVLSFFRTDAGGTARIVAQLSEEGDWDFNDHIGDTQATLVTRDGNDDCVLSLGLTDDVRGKLVIERDPTPAGERPGMLVLTGEDGTNLYLWFTDTSGTGVQGQLRGDTADPGINYTNGNLVAAIL